MYEGTIAKVCGANYLGHVPHKAIANIALAGMDVTNCLITSLKGAGAFLTSTAEYEIAKEIKEHCAEVALDYDEWAFTGFKPQTYELPDGQSITMDKERIRCAEALFRPALVGNEGKGLHERLSDVMYSCDLDTRRGMLGNITLCGGTAKLRGFQERLQKEFAALAPLGVKIQMRTARDPENSAWLGGSVFVSITDNPSVWMTKEE